MNPGKAKSVPNFSIASAVLLLGQFSSLAVLVMTTRGWPLRLSAGCVLFGAGGLGVWAVAAMGIRQLRPQAEVAPHAQLRRCGPYAFIRHPMYAALLLGVAGLLIQDLSYGRAGWAGGLALVLALKIRIEERCLRERFPDYADYQRRTGRLLPGIW